MIPVSLNVYQGRAADRNGLAVAGARALADELAGRLGLQPTPVGRPGEVLGGTWAQELALALPELRAMADRLDAVFSDGRRPVTALSRCVVSMATLPVVARHRPDAYVVWLDAHGDLNTPETTRSGYLGGMALAAPLGLWDSGLGAGLAAANLVLVGERELDPEERAFVAKAGVPLLAPGADLSRRVAAAVAGRPAYVHLDCDVLSAGLVPTEFMCDDGLSLADLRAACEALSEVELVGLEVSELQISWREGGPPVSPALLVSAIAPLLDRLCTPK